jgi:hypothetical protein
MMILVLYVDDLLITSSSSSDISLVKDILHDNFSMKDMGPLHFFIGLDVSVRSHSWIAAGAEPDAHQFMSRFI